MINGYFRVPPLLRVLEDSGALNRQTRANPKTGLPVAPALVFISQEYDQGDIFIIDYVNFNPEYCSGNYWTMIRRMTNYGEVFEVEISDFIEVIY